MESVAKNTVYGLTGEIGKDGVLSPDGITLLNTIQERAANRVFEYAQRLQPGEDFPTVAMATGIGKGNIIHRVIENQMRFKPDSKVLVIAGTKLELVKQTHAALAEHQRRGRQIEVEEYIESENIDTIQDAEEINLNGGSLLYKTGKYGSNANVHVSTIQAIQSLYTKGDLRSEEYDLVIVDEVHNAGTKTRYETLQQFKKVIGFTATPRRHTGDMKNPEDYGFTIVESLSLPEAQDLRLLPPLCGVQIDTKGLVSEIPMSSSGQIDFKKLEKLLKDSPDLRPYIADRIAKIIISEGKSYKTVITVNFVWEAQELAQLLRDKGIKVGVAVNKQAAKQIHTDDIPSLDAIERYKLPQADERSVQVLISPYVASEGFDAPFTEVLVWASPTDSPLRYTQYTGRLARRAEGKLFGLVIDCLYQTSQYNWSYNFGMWMKGNVKQLDNGLLWLGPETDIERLADLSARLNLRKHVDLKNLDELSYQDTLLGVQDGDFKITVRNLTEVFVGHPYKLVPIANEVIEQLVEQDYRIIATRLSGSQHIRVVTDEQLFIQAMQSKGVSLRNETLEEVSEDDLVISKESLEKKFIGNYNRIRPIVDEIVSILQAEDSMSVQMKLSGVHRVLVMKDFSRFIAEMLKRGIKLRDEELLTIQPTDFVISQPSLDKYFVNGQKLIPLATEVLNKLVEEDISFKATRRDVARYVPVITDRERFIAEMLKRGARLKDR